MPATQASSVRQGAGQNQAYEVIPIRFHIRHILGVLCALIAVFAIAAPASAQNCSSPTESQYGDQAQQLEVCAQGGGGSQGGSATADPSGTTAGSLPFSGLDLGLMGAAAVALVGSGVVIRRRARAEGA